MSNGATHKQIAISDRLHLPGLNLNTARSYHLAFAFQDFWTQRRQQSENHLDKLHR